MLWIFVGFGMVGGRVAIQPFVCEICKVHTRSWMATIYMLFYTVGFALAILLGAFLPWRISIGLFGSFSLAELVLLRVR